MAINAGDYVEAIANDLPDAWRFPDTERQRAQRHQFREFKIGEFPQWVLRQVVAGNEKPVWRMVELDEEKKWLLLILGDAAYLLGFADPNERYDAEVRFLGSLAGGSYSEKLGFDEADRSFLEMTFEHDKLPGGVLALRALDEHEIDAIDDLREILRRWGSSPSPSH